MSGVETARNAVEEIKRKRKKNEVVQKAEELVQDCEKSELSERSFTHINEAARIYQERGWLEIYS